jgi:WD40 repeat protein
VVTPGRVLTGHTAAIYGVAFSADGNTLASCSDDTSVRRWNPHTGQPIGQPLYGSNHGGQVGVAISADGTLASGGIDYPTPPTTYFGTVWRWNPAGVPIGQPLTGPNLFSSVAFSPDGKILAAGNGDGLVRFWDAATGQLIGQPDPNVAVASIQTIAFSPNGKVVASGMINGMIRLWDAATGKPIGQPWAAHSMNIHGIAFSRDGILATASLDHTVRLWNPDTHQPIGAPLTGHGDEVETVTFSPDGRILATGSADRTIRLWDVATHRHRMGSRLQPRRTNPSQRQPRRDNKTVAPH